MRVIKLKTVYKNILIYKWYDSNGNNGVAVESLGKREKYKYVKSITEAKKYIDKKLNEKRVA